jgi:hypothetical protein
MCSRGPDSPRGVKLLSQHMPIALADLLVAIVRAARRRLVAVSLCAALFGCTLGDTDVPWDTAQMTQEIVDDLRRFEGFDAEVRQVEVLAVKVVDQYQQRPAPLDPFRVRTYRAIVWMRVESAAGIPNWILVDAFRGADQPWRRSLIFREFVSPPPARRPGEDATGEWHGFIRNDTPPPSEQVCEFAGVEFLKPTGRTDHRVAVEKLRSTTWRRVTGAPPTCGVPQASINLITPPLALVSLRLRSLVHDEYPRRRARLNRNNDDVFSRLRRDANAS